MQEIVFMAITEQIGDEDFARVIVWPSEGVSFGLFDVDSHVVG